MAHSTSLTHNQPPAVEKKRRWSLMILASIIGAAIALVAMLTLAALMDRGPIPFIVGTMAVGTIWGIATKVSSNLTESETVFLVLQSYSIQQSYRKTIEQYLGTVLREVTTGLRTNTTFMRQGSVDFDVCDQYRFQDRKKRIFFTYSFAVLPEPGSPPRPLDEGFPPPDLPSYDPSSTYTIERKPATVTGVSGSIRQGTILGFTTGASASLMSLLLGAAGIILGVLLAKLLIDHRDPPKSRERVLLLAEFKTELGRHMDRLQYCARDNNIGFRGDVQVRWTSAEGWRSKSVQSTSMASVNRTLSGRIVWSDEVVEGGVRTRSETKSMADGSVRSRQLPIIN
ncbi:hypothetical protein M440DRAFT_1405579 [Trichoderma longibrachiatum ATCC 18648]|uniref:Uncharacterized protein n=1 Tax=Trichoderma longibrachiatum ATCC 18648 TaxID=983965 RepID=A0A2T4BSC0_TRILO|nr:hypothetical protein M440DRAFT_1405579 [Trichoderma longibrachiatum ATCC 18648]